MQAVVLKILTVSVTDLPLAFGKLLKTLGYKSIYFLAYLYESMKSFLNDLAKLFEEL